MIFRPASRLIKAFYTPTFLIRYKNTMAKLVTMKLETPEFKSLFTPELLKLSDIFKKYDYEIRIAGGAVRDLLQDKVPNDVDFATTATPDQMKEMFEIEEIRMINAKGEKHGTITPRINDRENFEVTTLRNDVLTDGRHAVVEFIKDWQLDASRRDLTVNSMFLGLDGTIYDYFNGVDDLKNSKVRFVGDASTRIREDYLRILRYFRFFGRIAKNADCHEPNTLDCIRENVSGLERISGERLWVELKKIVCGNFAPELMSIILDCGVGTYLGLSDISDAGPMFEVYKNAIEHTPNPITILASILRNDNDLQNVHKRLKLSNDELNTAQFILDYRREFLDHDDKIKFCRSKSVELAGKDPKIKAKMLELLKYHGCGDLINEFEAWTMPKFPVNGKSLILLGVKGPMFTKILNELRIRWIESEFELSEEKLLEQVDDVRMKLSS